MASLDNLEFDLIGPEMADRLKRGFSEDEIKSIVVDIARDNSPGLNGSPWPFSRPFWNWSRGTSSSLFRTFIDMANYPTE